MESPLEVLSRAATVVQDKATSESKLPNKELPTTKWRRERRRLSEYQTHSTTTSTTSSTNNNNNNLPIKSTIKSRSPPPYREPLPGSTFALTLLRPTVITVGPKVLVKEEVIRSPEETIQIVSPGVSSSSTLKRSETVSPNGLGKSSVVRGTGGSDTETASNGLSSKNDKFSESISMCDTVIDEHFRRSLGNNYMELFDKTQGVQVGAGVAATSNGRISANGTSSPETSPKETKSAVKRVSNSPTPSVTVAVAVAATSPAAVPVIKAEESFSVDDHFAKALGETWKKLNATQRDEEEEEEADVMNNDRESSEEEIVDDEEEEEEESVYNKIRRKNKRLRIDERK